MNRNGRSLWAGICTNDTWDVTARTVDYEAIRAHLAKYCVRYPSDQLNELIGGYRDPNRGFTAVVGGRIVRLGDTGGHNRFLDELAFAAGAYWHCDDERAIQRKARDVRGRLADALEQLPTNAKSAVHVGLETLDGAEVEEERFLRMLWSVLSFDAKGKDLRWIYCHLFQSYAPPDDAWVIDETVHNFGSIDAEGDEPLHFRSAILPADADHVDGVHWNRPTP